MRRKFLLSLATIGVVVAASPLIAAFEAHIINVTAQIESRLFIDPIPDIDFGTAFPQEKLDQFFDVVLAATFLNDPTLDDLEYVVRQKPKCVDRLDSSLHPPVQESSTSTGGIFICPDVSPLAPNGSVMMPLLCPYLSKEEITTDGTVPEGENDGLPVPPFHGLPGPWKLSTTLAYQATGTLIKSGQDIEDSWNVDLKVPCFKGECAQDWSDFVLSQSASTTIKASDYEADPIYESKIWGCDLWLEVTATSAPACIEQLDLMLVLDTSGSIDPSEMASLKSAAIAFVGALSPTADGVHIGVVRFSTTGTLIQHLTGIQADVESAINGLPASGQGVTNLEDAILDAQNELDNAHEHERPTIPDVMVIITDGAPTADNGIGTPAARAATQATSAQAAAIEIFGVGVGITASNADYMKNSIVSPPSATHYFDAVDFGDLQAILEGLPICPDG